MSLLLLTMACGDPPEVAEWKCVGPLVELVKWRDEVGREMTFGGKAFPDLARDEQLRVDAAVSSLSSRRAECEMAWTMILYQEADNPGLALRERALRTLLTPAGGTP